METRFKTSFIPKNPIQTSDAPGVVIRDRKKGASFFTLFSVVLFLVAIAGSVGVFLMQASLKRTIENQIATLKVARDSFDEKFISEATRLNERIVAANRILEKHVGPSAIFKLLENSTLQTVQFVDFDFSEGEDGLIKVVGSGIGDEFTSIVLQSDEFGNTGYLRDVIFSDLQASDENDVDFRFEATLDPRLISYRKTVEPDQEDLNNEEQ